MNKTSLEGKVLYRFTDIKARNQRGYAVKIWGITYFDFKIAFVKGTQRTRTRFITTPRDLATYVHYDALYQAYLNACLILLAEGASSGKALFDPGIPFQASDFVDHQQGFAHFGPPHILTLVTEVATRALKAVRYQKFNVHRRMRPEALAARLHKANELALNNYLKMAESSGLDCILHLINKANGWDGGNPNYLLPMAYAEGSPMHPSYGAGHATVAGACVTILKAFFDHTHVLTDQPLVPDAGGTALTPSKKEVKLTVEGELNKLASNISIGRDWAGVHYYSDYVESIKLGEKVAIGLLEEQMLTYPEDVSMTVPCFDGNYIQIKSY